MHYQVYTLRVYQPISQPCEGRQPSPVDRISDRDSRVVWSLPARGSRCMPCVRRDGISLLQGKTLWSESPVLSLQHSQ